jgi:hypothetical protein
MRGFSLDRKDREGCARKDSRERREREKERAKEKERRGEEKQGRG